MRELFAALGIAAILGSCSSPNEVDSGLLIGDWKAGDWLVTNRSDSSETFDGLMFYRWWTLELGGDSVFVNRFRLLTTAGVSVEAGRFRADDASIRFMVAGTNGQLSVGGREFAYSLVDGQLILRGASRLSWDIGQLVGWKPREVQFLDYTADMVIRLERD